MLKKLLSMTLALCMLLSAWIPEMGLTAEAAGTREAGNVIDVTAYGADPSGMADSAVAIQKAIEAAKAVDGPVTINFPKGEYQIYPDKAYERELYISNTVGSNQSYSKKKIGILLENMKDVTIEGNGSFFMFHGKMMTFAAISCENIVFQNYEMDFQVPTVVDATVESVSGNTAVVYVPECYNYEINGTSITWKSDVSPYTNQLYWSAADAMSISQIHDTIAGTTVRAWNPLFSNVSSIEDMGNHRLKFTYSSMSGSMKAGYCFQMRPTVRDHAGMFFWKSNGVTLQDVDVHFLHGFGIVGQNSSDITLKNDLFATPEGSGRTTVGYADFIQMSGCKGEVRVEDCTFANPHDDPINVHGTFMQVVERISSRQFKVRYMHNETAGFPNFFEGDEVEFMTKGNMLPVADSTAKVTAVEGPSGDSSASPTGNLTDIIITLDKDMPESIVANKYVVENITYTPNVVIQNNYFKETPTRGILVTTRKKVEIRNNIFDAMGMAAIYISDDAQSWYESGPTKDVTIENNIFRRSGIGTSTQAVILVEPTNPTVSTEQTVHENMNITGNTFYMADNQLLNAKSVKNLSFTNNRVYRYDPNVNITLTVPKTVLQLGEAVTVSANATGRSLSTALYAFNGCKNVTLAGNTYDGGLKVNASISNMTSAEITKGEGENVIVAGSTNQLAAVGSIAYESSDESVVTVTNSGVVKASGEGTANVRAYTVVAGRKFVSDEASFTVGSEVAANLPKNVTVTGQKESTADINDKITYQAAVEPSEANQEVTWSVLDPVTQAVSDHASITQEGVLTCTSNGTVEVVATTANGQTDSKLLVIQAPQRVLSSAYSIVDEEPENWSILEDGSVRILVRSSGLWSTQTAHNIIVTAPEGDMENITATVKMSGKTAKNYDEAGLIFYNDNDKYVSVQRKHADGNPRIHVVTETNQNDPNEDDPKADAASTDIYFKLVKEGSTVTGYYSENGREWTEVRSVTNAALGNSFSVGVIAASGSNGLTPFVYSQLKVGETEVPFTVENTAPVASEVTNAYSTETKKLTAAYTYTDTDQEGTSIVKWMAADTADSAWHMVSGLHGADVTAPAALDGKYVKAVIVPQDARGMYGAAVMAAQPVLIQGAAEGGEQEAAEKSAESRLAEAAFVGIAPFAAFSSTTYGYVSTATKEQKNITASFKTKEGNAKLEIFINGKICLDSENNRSEVKDLAMELSSGLNTVLVRGIAEDGETQTEYRFVIVRTGDSQSALSGIKLDGTALADFSADRYSYDYTAVKGAKFLQIQAEGVAAGTKISMRMDNSTYDGSTAEIPLKDGRNDIMIQVRPETRFPVSCYTLTVMVPSDANANLKNAEFGDGLVLNEAFSAGTTSYTGTIYAKELAATFRTEEAGAAIAVALDDGSQAAQGTGVARAQIPIYQGENWFTVTVTSPDGKTVKEYIYTLTGENEAALSSLDWTSDSYTGYGNTVAFRNTSQDGNAITLRKDEAGNTQTFASGIGSHATCTLIYNIEGFGYQTFSTYMGVDQEINNKSEADMIFRIYVDNELKYESDTLTGNSPMVFKEVSVEGASELKLVADKIVNNWSDHADFADAKFTTDMPTRTLPAVDEDRESLKAALEQFKDYLEGDYTEATWAAFAAARKTAQDVLADQNALKETITEADKALKEAAANLKTKAEEEQEKIAAEKASLRELCETSMNIEKDLYTEETYSALKDACAAALKVCDAGNASMEDVLNAKSIVDEAVKALKTIPQKEIDPPQDHQKTKQLAAPSIKSLKSTAGKEEVLVKITVNKTANADAYIVYRTVRGSSAVLKIGTTTTGTIIDKNPVSGKTASYYAVATSDNPEYGMSKNGTSKNITLASATKKVSVKKDRKAVKVSWKKVKKAKTYYVYRSRKKASGYARIAKVSAKRNYYVDRKVKVGKKYYYRVVTKGKTAFSNLSKPSKAVKAAK